MPRRSATRPVIVGYDGGDGGRSALLWALRRTARARKVVAIAAQGHDAGRLARAWGEDGEAVVPAAELHVRKGRAAHVLEAEADLRDAELIVVGHRRGRRLGALRGSVARELVKRATRPIVIVPDAVCGEGRIVVGFDGGQGARDALHWALRHGHGQELVVAVACRDRAGTALPVPVGLGRHDREAQASALLDELVLEDDLLIDAEYTTEIVDGHPGEGLAAVAARVGAREIVVGAGPHALEVLEHGDRPVIVVPPETPAG